MLTLAGCSREAKPSFKSLDITGADYARRFSLPDADGRVRTLTDFKGKLVVVFFGYTQCPDVCPTTLTSLVETKRLLGADSAKLVAVFISVDPERDTPQLLKSYVSAFDPSFVALRGTPDETAAAAKEFKVFYRKAPGKTPESYTVDHTAASYVFDTEGRLRLYVRHNTPPADLAADLKGLLGNA
ncbi:MAG: SCO family protein [Burkholderiales bacterium]